MQVSAKYQIKTFIIRQYKYIALVLIVLFSQSMGLYRNMDRMRHKALAGDCDGYWHLLRVREIHDSGSWDNEINFRGNAPFGERIHWTHAMDIVLLGGAYIGSLFTDFDSSLYWFGVFVGPLFFGLSLVAIIFFGRAVLGARRGVYLALLFAASSLQVQVVYSVAKPDHHCLVNFLFILYYFSFILLLRSPRSTILAIFTGMLGALGLWSSIELLVLIGLSVLYLGILWIIDGDTYINANYVLTLVLSICISITVLMDEKPSNYWVISYDKRSIVHVTLFIFIMLYWLAVIFLDKFGVGKEIVSRLMIAIGGGVLLLFLSLDLFPKIIYGPMAHVDPRLYAIYLDRVSEFGTDVGMKVHSLLLVGPGLIYLVCAVYKAALKNRIFFSWLILSIFVYTVLALRMNRWALTLGIVTLLPNALILIAISNWHNTVKNTVLALLIVFSIVVVPLLAPFVLNPVTKTAPEKFREYDSKVIDVLSFMESQSHTSTRETILADISIGPAIMYYTSFNVVGTMNHNNYMGIIDTHKIVTAENDFTAKSLIEARGIDYVLVDDRLKGFARFNMNRFDRSYDHLEDRMFIDRLTDGCIPDWLVITPLPKGLADTFWLYRVIGDNVKDE